MLLKSPELESIQKENETVYRIFDMCQHVIEPDYYIGAGCIAQSYWNFKHQLPLMTGIKDIDIVYFDPSGTRETEEALNFKANDLFSFCPVPIETVNQARVHEWYFSSFGIEMAPYKSLEDAIDSWPTTATCIGGRMMNGRIEFYDPFQLKDLLSLDIRPNKRLVTKSIYDAKVNRWKEIWPKLKIQDW